MVYWIGLFLVVSGLLSLGFNEFTLKVRRVWSWRRDDADPIRDIQINNYYRGSVYLASVISIELGQYLAKFNLAPWPIRVAVYLLFGCAVVWKIFSTSKNYRNNEGNPPTRDANNSS